MKAVAESKAISVAESKAKIVAETLTITSFYRKL